MLGFSPLARTSSLFVALVSFSFSPAYAESQGPQGSYYEILRKGVSAFQFKSEGMNAAAGGAEALAVAFRDSLLQSGIDDRMDALRGSMRTALADRPGWGILLEVRVYDNPITNHAYVYTGGPIVVGIGPTPAEAAAAYLVEDRIMPPIPGGTRRSDGSYMIWITRPDGGELDIKQIPQEMDVWRLGGDIVAREKLGAIVAAQRAVLLTAAASHSTYVEAAKTAKTRTQDVAVKATIDRLERQRVAAQKEWAASLQRLEDATQRYERDAWMADVAGALQVLGLGLEAAEKITSAPRTEIDGAERSDSNAIDVAGAKNAASQSLLAARNAGASTTTMRAAYIKSGEEIRVYYFEEKLISRQALPAPDVPPAPVIPLLR